MALSEDQKAMLRLLAQRGEQGYEDIAALKGQSVDDVRAQVREAVTQLEDEGLPPPAIPVDPKPAEPAAEPPVAEPEPPTEPPKAPPPAPEPVAAKPTPPPPASPAAKSGGPKISLPSDPGIRGALIAGVLVVVALVAVLIISGSDGDSGDSTTAAPDTAQEAGDAQNTASRELTKAVLEPVDGSDAGGVAVFGRVKKSLALQIEASGLEPTAKGQTYAIWLSQSPQKMLPLASTPVDQRGRIGAQFVVPIEVLGYLANETFKQIAITLAGEGALKASLKKATEAKESPEYTGTEVLRGTVTGSIVGAAKDE